MTGPVVQVTAKPSGEHGFTLVELIMVIVVAVVAMYPLISMFANATANSAQPELVTKAVFLAQEKMEEILADYHSASRGYTYIDEANYPDVTAIPQFPGFTISVAVAAEATWDSVDYKEVAVTVSHAAIPAVTLTTWVTR